MIVRPARWQEQAPLVAMGLRFQATVSAYTWFLPPSPAGVADLVAYLLELQSTNADATILVADQAGVLLGAIALIIGLHPVSGHRYADEIAWWIDPEHRGALRAGPQLLVAAEDWAQGKGVSMIKMVEPLPSRVGRFYLHHGYRAVETAHVKVFGG